MTDEQQDPAPPTPSSQGEDKPSDQPDLGKAAKDFWVAAKAKAKELGGKATVAAKELGAKATKEAKELRATPQPTQPATGAGAEQAVGPVNNLKDKALDVWRRAPTLVVVCGAGLLLLCLSCCLCGGCLGPFLGSGRNALTKEELIAKIDALGNPCDKQKFLKEIGKPERTQTLDGRLAGVFWYYKCTDGTVQVVLLNPDYGVGEHNDKSKVYVSKINDF